MERAADLLMNLDAKTIQEQPAASEDSRPDLFHPLCPSVSASALSVPLNPFIMVKHISGQVIFTHANTRASCSCANVGHGRSCSWHRPHSYRSLITHVSCLSLASPLALDPPFCSAVVDNMWQRYWANEEYSHRGPVALVEYSWPHCLLIQFTLGLGEKGTGAEAERGIDDMDY